jgi:hypothetical protein
MLMNIGVAVVFRIGNFRFFQVNDDEADQAGWIAVLNQNDDCSRSLGELAHHRAIELERRFKAQCIEPEHGFDIGWTVSTE